MLQNVVYLDEPVLAVLSTLWGGVIDGGGEGLQTNRARKRKLKLESIDYERI
jgi:hypothetical protein